MLQKKHEYYKSRESECNRCNGRGRISVYNDVEGGICFACRGSGRLTDNFIY